MRAIFLALPIAFLASPAAAEKPAPTVQLPPELTDLKWADRLSDAMAAMSKAFLDMPIGEVEAAVEGRPATLADKRRTVRSETGMSEREIREQVQAAKPAMQAGMTALAAALPPLLEGVSKAQAEVDRATANVPRPDYPKR